MDRIEIKDLVCYCHHGVLKEENVLGQKFLVSASLFMDTRKAGLEDSLPHSVDYAQVAHTIDVWMKENTCQLIEAVAEQMAREILLTYPVIDSVELTIKKPWAPILLPLDTVSVTIRRGWTKVYVGVGSNMGNRRKYIDDAFAGIRNDRMCKGAYMSSVIETEPYGYTEQDRFLNGVICFQTLYSPQELLTFLHNLEKEGNRQRQIHWGPRTIDLDILFYGNEVLQTEDLIIPHREVAFRSFVLEPMEEIAPFFVHPVFDKTITQLYNEWKKENKSGKE